MSLVPYAIDSQSREIILHVSALAAHTGFMRARPDVSLLVTEAEQPGAPVHALPRASLQARAEFCEPQSPLATHARQIYLARFPEAEPITALGDFRFVRLQLLGARQVAGFGAARSLDAQEVQQALGDQA